MGVGMHECQVTELNPAQIKLGVATPGSKALEFEKRKIGHLKTTGGTQAWFLVGMCCHRL